MVRRSAAFCQIKLRSPVRVREINHRRRIFIPEPQTLANQPLTFIKAGGKASAVSETTQGLRCFDQATTPETFPNQHNTIAVFTPAVPHPPDEWQRRMEKIPSLHARKSFIQNLQSAVTANETEPSFVSSPWLTTIAAAATSNSRLYEYDSSQKAE